MRSIHRNDGAVTLMTLAFMMIVGAMSMVFLWSLATATGAYNTLYIANQNAAVAAAGVVQTQYSEFNEDIPDGAQMFYRCSHDSGHLTFCQYIHQRTSGGPTDNEFKMTPPAAAATKVLNQSLINRPFGMDFGYEPAKKNVALVRTPNDPVSGMMSYVEIVNVERDSAEVRQAMKRTGNSCQRFNPGSVAGHVIGGFPGDVDRVHCWVLRERGVTFPPQTTSGVITRARAKIDLLPGCAFSFCEGDIYVVAAATQEQVQAVEDYSQYYYYNPWE